MPSGDPLQAAPHTERVVPGDTVVAASLEVEGEQVRAEVLPERARWFFAIEVVLMQNDHT